MFSETLREMEDRDTAWSGCWSPCGEWMRHDNLDNFGWAAIFFWGALVVLASSTDFGSNYPWLGRGWSTFFAGAGVIVLFETAVRLFVPRYRRSIAFGFVMGSILLGIGLGGWDLVLPVILLAAGISILAKAFQKSW